MKHLEEMIGFFNTTKISVEAEQDRLSSQECTLELQPSKSDRVDFQITTVAYSRYSYVYREQ